MNLAQLRAFEALARFGNFSRAAEALNVSQPAITTQLKTLQQEYRVSLFRRQGHSIELSSLGQEVLPRVKQAIRLMAELDRLLHSSEPYESGHIAIGLCDPHSTLGFVSNFARLYPGTKIFCTVSNSTRLLKMISESQIDIAIVNTIEIPQDVYSQKIKPCSLFALVTKDHRWATKGNVEIENFQNENVILRERESTSQKLFLYMAADKAIAPNVVLEFNSREGLKRAVSKKMGIGVTYEVSLDKTENLVDIKIKGSETLVSQYLVCAPELRYSPSVTAFFHAYEDATTKENLSAKKSGGL